MYAIRSYYDRIRLLKDACGNDDALRADVESIDAYRKSLELDPAFGEAYWSLRITSYNVCYTKLLRDNLHIRN